jgi:hypothetical protein
MSMLKKRISVRILLVSFYLFVVEWRYTFIEKVNEKLALNNLKWIRN